MTCASPERDRSYLQALACRITWLECALKAWGHILHTMPTSRVRFAAVASVTEDPEGRFTVTWFSTEGNSYEVQESGDGMVWYLAARPVPGASGNMTSWVSAPVPGVEAVFFRVVALPRSLVCCDLPARGVPVRYTDRLVGPTGGNPNGGCSSCDGTFDNCEPPPTL
jgi:hypothetical protein